jgi:heat shock protein HtpX
MAFFIAFVGLVAWLIGEGFGYGYALVPAAVIFSSFSALGSYFISDKIVLGLSGARLIDKKDHFELYSVVENIAIGTGIPTPKIYVINSPAPNAFATGRNPKHAVVCVTSGLLEKLDRTELEGVIAHEIAHIRDYDILLMSVVAVLVGTVAILAGLARRGMFFGGGRKSSRDSGRGGQIIALFGLLAVVLSPLIAQIIKLAISRQREFLADAEAAKITRFPEGLARALEKISADPAHKTKIYVTPKHTLKVCLYLRCGCRLI